jgi:hypothetical protein
LNEFCRKEEPTVFEVRVGFVRVCRRDVRIFEVPREDVIVEDMVGLICASGGNRGGLGQESDQSFIAEWETMVNRDVIFSFEQVANICDST